MATKNGTSLVGRTDESDALERWLDEVGSGKAGTALIEGEAGIGKTRLAEVAREAADQRSFQVCFGQADELDGSRPFGALGDALGVAPKLPAASPLVLGGEFRLVDQFVEHVERLALGGPVAILVEDMHWADPGTVVALRAIGRRLAHLPVALLGTLRPWPQSAELKGLVRAWRGEGALHLTLPPLEPGHVTELAVELVGASPGPALARQLESAAGNPLFVHELIGALSEHGAIEYVDEAAEATGHSLPPSLRLLILERLGAVPERALGLLRLASTLGTNFSLTDLATVSGRPAAEVADELLEVKSAGIIEATDQGLRFRHDLVRDAVYEDLPESIRRGLHRDAGRLLAAAGAPTLQVAEQLSLGATRGDREAVRWLSESARESMLRAPQTAVGLLERALELADPEDPARDALLADLAGGLVWAARPDDGRSVAEELLARGVPSPLRERVRATVVRALWLDARWQELVDLVDGWLTAADLDDTQRGLLLADMAFACTFGGDPARAEPLALEALAIGEALGDEAIVFGSQHALGPIYNFTGRYEDGLTANRRALEISDRGVLPDLARFHPHFFYAMALFSTDQFPEALAMFETGLRIREALGTVWDLPLYQAGLANLQCQVGDWDAALAAAETGIEIANEVGTRLGVIVCAAVAALINVHRDEIDEAQRQLAIAQREIERTGQQWGIYWAALAAGQIAEARGGGEALIAALSDGWDRLEPSPGLQLFLGPELVRVLLAHDPHRARAIADAVCSRADEAEQRSSAKGSALLCQGRVDNDPEVLAGAVDAFRASGWRHELANSCEANAAALAQAGDLTAARALFEEALEIYDGLGARRDVARASATMRAHRLRRGSRAKHTRALKGWESLTERENDVVRLTVEGLTNPEIGERLFISRRTVQTHLAHAFAKLDVSSRVELAAAAARRPEAEE